MKTKEEAIFLLNDYTEKEIDEKLHKLKKSDGIIISRDTKLSKEFNSDKYYEKAKKIIKYLRNKGIKNDVILQCINYNELKNVDIDEKNVGFIYATADEIYAVKPATMSEVKEINKILDDMVDNIRISDISELEKFIACFKIDVSFKPYLRKKDEEHTNSETCLNEILYNDYIVCGGYSYLLMELLIRVGINSRYFEISRRDSDKNDHARLLVSLDSGYYICDPTNGLKVKYYDLVEYLINYNMPFQAIREVYKKDFDPNKIAEYVSEIENNKKMYTKFKKEVLSRSTAEERLMCAIFGDDKVVDDALTDLKTVKRVFCSPEIEQEFEAIRNLNPTLRNKKERELISRKYKELPVMHVDFDNLTGALLTFDERMTRDDDIYRGYENTFLDIYDRETFYTNIYGEFSDEKKNNKFLFQILCDILNELFPKEFKDLCQRFPKVINNLMDLDSEFEQFLSEVCDLLLAKNNNEISIEDIVLASSNVEQKVLGLDENQRQKYYDDTLRINKRIKSSISKNK